LTSYFAIIDLNTVLPSTSGSLWSKFCTSFSHACYMNSSSQNPWFNHPNNIRLGWEGQPIHSFIYSHSIRSLQGRKTTKRYRNRQVS
jgi:hypothetical protein